MYVYQPNSRCMNSSITPQHYHVVSEKHCYQIVKTRCERLPLLEDSAQTQKLILTDFLIRLRL